MTFHLDYCSNMYVPQAEKLALIDDGASVVVAILKGVSGSAAEVKFMAD